MICQADPAEGTFHNLDPVLVRCAGKAGRGGGDKLRTAQTWSGPSLHGINPRPLAEPAGSCRFKPSVEGRPLLSTNSKESYPLPSRSDHPSRLIDFIVLAAGIDARMLVCSLPPRVNKERG